MDIILSSLNFNDRTVKKTYEEALKRGISIEDSDEIISNLYNMSVTGFGANAGINMFELAQIAGYLSAEEIKNVEKNNAEENSLANKIKNKLIKYLTYSKNSNYLEKSISECEMQIKEASLSKPGLYIKFFLGKKEYEKRLQDYNMTMEKLNKKLLENKNNVISVKTIKDVVLLDKFNFGCM